MVTKEKIEKKESLSRIAFGRRYSEKKKILRKSEKVYEHLNA